jgi:hypothetical protein
MAQNWIKYFVINNFLHNNSIHGLRLIHIFYSLII